MARPRRIDREQLLDRAEQIVAEQGAQHLSFGSLAKASDVPKASIQSVFGTRESLLDELLDRWMRLEKARYQEALAGNPSPANRLKAHLAITADETTAAGSRMTSTLAAMVGTGTHSISITAWYEDRLGDLAATTDTERQHRIAYLAAEGAFYVRNMAKMEMSEALWRDIFEDLKKLVFEDEPEPDGHL